MATHLLPASIQDILTTFLSDARYTHLAWHILLYTPIVIDGIPAYFGPTSGPKHAKRRGNPYIPLLGHIILSFAIVIRFQYRILTNPANLFPHAGPIATRLDLAMGIVNASLGMVLNRKNNKGGRLARTSFQSSQAHIMICSIMAYHTEDPGWLDGMVKLHNSFLYVRYFLIFLRPLGMLDGLSGKGYYAFAIFVTFLIAAAEGRTPNGGGMLVYILGVLGFTLVDQWISGMITPKNAKTNPFFRLALFIGLVDYPTYEMLREASEDAQKQKAT